MHVERRRPAEAEQHPPDPETPAAPDENDRPLPADAAPRPTIDPAVRDILREEAEREARLRRSDADPVETQAEMPFDTAPTATGAAAAATGPEGDEETAPISRRDLLPDIEELNSTLRDTGERSTAEAATSDIESIDLGPRRRRGVRLGFLIVLAIAAGGAALYANAPVVANALPQAAPLIAAFVETVDQGRFWLDDMARSLASMTSGSSDG